MDNATNEDRIKSLLDQLENPGLTAREIQLIEMKLEVLKSNG